MIVPDVNMLVYAHNAVAPRHSDARLWWNALLDGTEEVGLPWVVSTGFVRVITNPRIVSPSFSSIRAVDLLMDWFERVHVISLEPRDGHLLLFRQNMGVPGGGTNLVPDAHIAALAMEYDAEIHSADSDFARFPGVRWRNPLA